MDDTRYITSGDFILREIGEESVLVPVGDVGEELENSMISFNDTYSFIWKQFSEGASIADVIRRAHEEYEDPEGVMELHIREASEELIARKIIIAD